MTTNANRDRSFLAEYDDPARRLLFEIDSLLIEATEVVDLELEKREMSRKLLAEKMGVTPGRVSQVLSGDENITFKTFVEMLFALNLKVHRFVIRDLPALVEDECHPHKVWKQHLCLGTESPPLVFQSKEPQILQDDNLLLVSCE